MEPLHITISDCNKETFTIHLTYYQFNNCKLLKNFIDEICDFEYISLGVFPKHDILNFFNLLHIVINVFDPHNLFDNSQLIDIINESYTKEFLFTLKFKKINNFLTHIFNIDSSIKMIFTNRSLLRIYKISNFLNCIPCNIILKRFISSKYIFNYTNTNQLSFLLGIEKNIHVSPHNFSHSTN